MFDPPDFVVRPSNPHLSAAGNWEISCPTVGISLTNGALEWDEHSQPSDATSRETMNVLFFVNTSSNQKKLCSELRIPFHSPIVIHSGIFPEEKMKVSANVDDSGFVPRINRDVKVANASTRTGSVTTNGTVQTLRTSIRT